MEYLFPFILYFLIRFVRSKGYLAGFFILFSLCCYSQEQPRETIPVNTDSYVRKSIYQDTPKKHASFYNWLWGEHYSSLYYQPVTVRSLTLNSIYNNLPLVRQIPELHGLLLEDKTQHLYLLKPLGGSASFTESGFFRSVYDREEYENTYVGDFITEAYTIQHPYIFVVSDYLADAVGLISADSHVCYISSATASDTITDGNNIRDKLVNIIRLPDVKIQENILIDSIPELISQLKSDYSNTVDLKTYIKTRLFDMLIGDWNKISENWVWIGKTVNGNIIFEPIVVDRSHTFTKVDGFAFQELLNMLGLKYISDYKGDLKNVRKFNSLGYALDMTLTAGTEESMWIEQADILQQQVTDKLIDDAFSQLPKEMQDEEIVVLKNKLKVRRDNLKKIAVKYYKILQRNPVITGTEIDDKFLLEYDKKDNLRIRILNNANDSVAFDHTYNHKNTKEIWVYSLGGNNNIEVRGEKRGIPVLLIGGKGVNSYKVESGRNIKIYESKIQKEKLDSLSNVKIIYPSDEESTLGYDYTKHTYTQWSFTPIGIYDSDLGLNLGTSVAYTIYGFRRAPYTRRPQLSYDYANGFTYQGIFPDYDSRRSFHVSAFVGSPAYFSNFFGFGNSTPGFKDEKRKYNRVNINKYTIAPAFYYTFNKEQEFNVTSSFEMYDVKNPKRGDRYINEFYGDDHSVFDTKFFADLSVTYSFDKKMDSFFSRFNFLVTSGWVVNMGNVKRNFPYAGADVGFNLKITDRLTFATMMKGRLLFTDKYEFYQSATTELRGFRDNRFIGKQSFYQYSDIRWDMGRLENPFTPLNYGFFGGVDYGRVWYPEEDSKKWHSSYGGGFWLTILKRYTGKFSYFASKDTGRFMLELGMGF